MLVQIKGTPAQGYLTNFVMNVGETVNQTVQAAIPNCDAAPTPIDITGYTFKAQIKFPAFNILLTTENNGIVILNATNGQIQFNIPSATTASWPAGSKNPYDLWWIDTQGNEKPMLKGYFVIMPTITPVP